LILLALLKVVVHVVEVSGLILQWYELNSKGQEIFCKSWLPKEGNKVKGVVCFCHGYGDTCTFFFEGTYHRFEPGMTWILYPSSALWSLM